VIIEIILSPLLLASEGGLGAYLLGHLMVCLKIKLAFDQIVVDNEI
jgi:hypothetical protein